MSQTTYFDKPHGVLPRAQGHSKMKNVYRFGPRDLVASINDPYSHYIGGILKKAVLSPGVRVTTPLFCEFKDLDSSPWFYNTLMDFIGAQKFESGRVYEFKGTFRNYEFKGTLTLVKDFN